MALPCLKRSLRIGSLLSSGAKLSTSSMLNGKRGPITAIAAYKIVKNLDEEERAFLMEALQSKGELAGHPVSPIPSWSDLNKLAVYQSLPFIGFGFLDNLIMIVAGEYIDASIGATFAISTMAAAALGNTLSDVFGVGSAWYVEHWAAKLGVNPPKMTIEQLDMGRSRIAANAGRAIGVAVGCILGMFPLLFYSADHDDKKDDGNLSADALKNTTKK